MTTKDAALLYQRLGRPVPRELDQAPAEKVRNTRRKVVDGIEFRSTLEANVYQLLALWEKCGRIKHLQVQPVFLLQPAMRDPYTNKLRRAITYRADFSFLMDGQAYAVDAKGYRMDAYRIKIKLAAARFPKVRFEEWTRETLAGFNR